MRRKSKQLARSGYAIFCPTVFQGTMPACYDETDCPVVFPTELEAQREIADTQLIRIQEFLDGQRDYEDAIAIDEFILPVSLWADGSISIKGGRTYGMID
jgi:dienelactone hydrolase